MFLESPIRRALFYFMKFGYSIRFVILTYMKTLSPWINFNGNAEEAFNFYKSVLGGEFAKITRFKDIATAEYPVVEEDANKLMQIVLVTDSGLTLVGNDVPAFMGPVSENENRSKIYIDADNAAEALMIYEGLSLGGVVEVPMDEAGGAYFAMFRDKYGIEWIVELA